MALVIRSMREEDIPAVSTLAAKIWRAHYADINTPEQIEYMLADRYSHNALREDIANGQRYFIAQENDVFVGYASVSCEGAGEYFMHKCYVDPECHRKGIGVALLREVEKYCAPGSIVRLIVNRKGVGAINFYFKHGFVIEKAQETDVGGGYTMADYVMVKRLGG